MLPRSARQLAAEQCVAFADIVDLIYQLEPGGSYAGLEFVAVIHLAVAVGDAGEVQRCIVQGERSRFVALPVPKCFENFLSASTTFSNIFSNLI